jgi:zinc/manganese transport system permease protein
LLSAGLALFQAWAGIALAFYTDWPSSFWITALSAGTYLFSTLPSLREATMVSEPIGRTLT